jgi:hypothetical protein
MAHGKPNAISTAPVRFDDQDFADRLPTGVTGETTIFTDHVRAAHLIRRALLRPVAILELRQSVLNSTANELAQGGRGKGGNGTNRSAAPYLRRQVRRSPNINSLPRRSWSSRPRKRHPS